MTSVEFAVAQTLDEENPASEHHRVSDDNDLSNTQENLSLEGLDQTGMSLSHVGQVFMKKTNLTASPQPSFRRANSDDESGSSSTHPVGSNDSFSNHVQAHMYKACPRNRG